MKRLLALWIVLLALLAPAHTWAGTPYTIHWFMAEYPHSCEDARITLPSYFDVNGIAIPTFEVPGAFAAHPDKSESNEAEAPFDSVLLGWGSNRFDFKVSIRGPGGDGDNSCVDALEIVHLVSAPLGLKKPLFDVRREGRAFDGSTNLRLSLEEINPPLARDIVNLEAEIEAEREWLINHAAEAAALSERFDLLQQLETELKDLLTRPLDEIAEVDLDAIFDRYAEVVDDATRAAPAARSCRRRSGSSRRWASGSAPSRRRGRP